LRPLCHSLSWLGVRLPARNDSPCTDRANGSGRASRALGSAAAAPRLGSAAPAAPLEGRGCPLGADPRARPCNLQRRHSRRGAHRSGAPRNLTPRPPIQQEPAGFRIPCASREIPMPELLQDVRYALRALRKSPGLAAAAILTLALGIGANSAIFSVVNGVLLKPLPYAQPERLVTVVSQFPTMGFDRFWISPPEDMELQERSRSYAAIGAYRTGAASASTTSDPVRVTSAIATAELFQALGVPPSFGGAFTGRANVPTGGPVGGLSYGVWQRAFGADAALVGQAIDVSGARRTVLGSMPPGFDVADAGVEVWLAAARDRASRVNRGSHYL